MCTKKNMKFVKYKNAKHFEWVSVQADRINSKQKIFKGQIS